MMASDDTEIIVARHGETYWNCNGKWQGTQDIPLNIKGTRQAEELAVRLKEEEIEYIHSSDLARARETANYVRKQTGAIGVFEDGRLRERHLGMFEGWPIDKVAEYIGMSSEESFILDLDEILVDTLPTVERWETFSNRVWAALDEIANKRKGKKSLVVAHGGVLRAITMKLSLNGDPKLDFSNTDFIRISYDNGSWKLVEC